jgi:type II secretory pathway component GspD/PulD (secretin)
MINMDRKNFGCHVLRYCMAVFCLGLFVTNGYGQAAASGTPNEQKVTIAFDNADVKDVIRWAADLTDKNIIVHPGVAGKKITVVAGEPMSHEEAWQVFLSALQINGLAVMESAETVKIRQGRYCCQDHQSQESCRDAIDFTT